MRICSAIENRIGMVGGESGSALLEFSLVLPVMIILLFGVVDLGFGIQQNMVVTDAAHAGTTFGSVNGNDTNLAGMQQSAAAAANGIQSFAATASEWCSCAPNGSVVDCSSPCPAGAPLAYVQVKTSASMPVIFGFAGMPASFTLSGFSAVRVR